MYSIKLILGTDINIKHGPRACLDRNYYDGKIAKQMVGTFKNGTLHGLAMVVFHDDTKFISNFENGQPKGIVKFTLQFIYFLKNIYLAYFQCV